MLLSLKNIENLIFANREVQDILPEYSSEFSTWYLSKRSGLNILSQKSLLNVLNNITDNQLTRLEKFFNDNIVLKKTDSRICRNHTISVRSAEAFLNDIDEFQGNLCLSREGNLLYISIWR